MPVKFYLSSQANKAGEFPIRVSIMVNGTRYLTTAEYKVAGAAGTCQSTDEPVPEEPLRAGRLQQAHHPDLLPCREPCRGNLPEV